MKENRKDSWLPGILLSALILVMVLFAFTKSAAAIEKRTESDRLQALSDAISRASVQCYAIEGRYPPSVEYLEEHYGIVIDREKYHVFYDGWASNVMPDITVLPALEEEGDAL